MKPTLEAQSDRNVADEFSQSFVNALVEEPQEALRQLQGRTKQSPPSAVWEAGSSHWFAQQVGSALGSLPWYLATHTLVGRAAQQLCPRASTFKIVLTNSALTGFTVDSLLKPTEVDSRSSDFFSSKIGQWWQWCSFVCDNGGSSRCPEQTNTQVSECYNCGK